MLVIKLRRIKEPLRSSSVYFKQEDFSYDYAYSLGTFP
jgi:hypothetical protein